jgi:calcium-translocating P-type ATPase
MKDQDYQQRLLESHKPSKSKFSALFHQTSIRTGLSSTEFRKTFENFTGLSRALNVNEKLGLNPDDKNDIEERITTYGKNIIKEVEETTFMEFVLECLEDPTLRILLLASLVSLIIGIYQEGFSTGWIEGTAIFFAVFIVVSITAFNNWSKEQQFLALNKCASKKNVSVLRNSTIQVIDSEQLLVGDILFVKIGDILQADGVLISGSLKMDESALNGESDLIEKKPELNDIGGKEKIITPFIMSGTKITSGEGSMIVCAVGENTSSAKSLSLMQNEDDETDLEKKLKIVAGSIELIGYFMAIFIFGVMICKEILIKYFTGESPFNSELLNVVLNSFIIAVTVIVVAIPEGLPMAVTISLAFSVSKMKDERNLVRHLDASEIMGNCNNICTDKTGTLTEGRMNVSHILIGRKLFQANKDPIEEKIKNLLSEHIFANMSITVQNNEATGDNMTECGLVNFIISNKISYKVIVENPAYRFAFNSLDKFMITIRELKDEKMFRIYFKGAPERVLLQCGKYLNEEFKVIDIDENIYHFLNEKQEDFSKDGERTLLLAYKDVSQEELQEACNNHTDQSSASFFKSLLNKEAIVVTMFGISDLPKKDVKDAIQKCQKAGVTVRMVTGDNINTAIKIALNVDILKPNEASHAWESKNLIEARRPIKKEDNELVKPLSIAESNNYKVDIKFSNLIDFKKIALSESPYAMEGEDFYREYGGHFPEDKDKNEPAAKDNKAENSEEDKKKTQFKLKNPEQFAKLTKNLLVLARATPDHKYILVCGLKELGNVVAVTGDGTNDAPALSNSDVGFSMGIRGTDIAKEASDIVLLDDSFSSVVTAIKYGRNVYDCIRKFIQFQLTTNIVAVFMTLLGGIILKDSPLNAIQMLWVNLIMDSFASLALATEPPNDNLLLRKPYAKDSNIITKMMLVNIVSQAIYQIVVLSIIVMYGDVLFRVPSDRNLTHFEWNNVNGYHFTIFFNIFVFLQVFNSINARKLRKSEHNVFVGVFNNSLYLIVQAIIVVGQLLMVTFGGRALRVHALTFNQHLICILIGSTCLLVGYMIKQLPFEDEQENNDTTGKSVEKHTGLTSRFRQKSRNVLATKTKTRNK